MSDETTNGAAAPASEQDAAAGPAFTVEKVYVKDVSFEAPNSPGMFTQEWNPDTNLDLNTHVNPLSSDNYEVELAITITVKSSDKTAFLVEVTQAGVFFITGYAQEQINHLLAAYCPNILFPYAREVIASLVSKGSFPELHLSPINFDALYARRLQEEQAKEQGAAE